jgi:hypothetical protein
MKIKNDEERYFRTTNFSLAVFLYAQNQQISGVNTINEKQKEFVFAKTNSLEELVFLYKYGEKDDELLKILIHKYEQARRELLELLKDKDF